MFRSKSGPEFEGLVSMRSKPRRRSSVAFHGATGGWVVVRTGFESNAFTAVDLPPLPTSSTGGLRNTWGRAVSKPAIDRSAVTYPRWRHTYEMGASMSNVDQRRERKSQFSQLYLTLKPPGLALPAFVASASPRVKQFWPPGPGRRAGPAAAHDPGQHKLE